MALTAARNLRAAVDDLLVGVQADASTLIRLLEGDGFRVQACPQAALGMGYTLATLAQAVPAVFPHWPDAALMVARADLPALQPDTLRAVRTPLGAGAALVRPRYQGRAGHPVGFAARYRAERACLQGDTGARDLLAQADDACHWIACNDPGVLLDIDTEEQLARHIRPPTQGTPQIPPT